MIPPCGCLLGFFENDQSECIGCGKKCSECDNNGECSSCVAGSGRSTTAPECAC